MAKRFKAKDKVHIDAAALKQKDSAAMRKVAKAEGHGPFKVLSVKNEKKPSTLQTLEIQLRSGMVQYFSSKWFKH